MDVVRFFHTVKYLKPVQIYGRLWFKLYRPRVDLSVAPDTRPMPGMWADPCKKPVSLLRENRFKFLNVTRELKASSDWNHPEWDKLWLYNLHYFDGLLAWDSGSKTTLHSGLIEKWIQENPPGTGNGWEPYPSSLRIVNWIKWALAGNALTDTALHSLAVRARYLFKTIEYHLLGNHLFANAKALMFAGLFFCGEESGAWLSKGLQILDRQVGEQILPDGGHFEQTPMYHSIILEDLLDLVNLMNTYGMGESVPEIWHQSIPKMMVWLEGMCHPDGRISFFNDAAFGIAPELLALKAYARRLGFPDEAVPGEGVLELSSSGYVRLENSRAVLIADVGKIGVDYLPGHAHADTLSFEFSIQGQRVFVNSGISCYGISPERLLQRGTASHNTLELEGQNSSGVWAGFRVAQRAYPIGLEVDASSPKALRIKCGHDGYTRLKGMRKAIHWREWQLTDTLVDTSLEIRDHVEKSRFGARVFYHLYPGTTIDLQAKTICLEGLCIQFQTDERVMLKDTFYYPEFGRQVPNKCLVLEPEKDTCSIKFIYTG